MLPRTIQKHPAKGHSQSCYKVSAPAMKDFASNLDEIHPLITACRTSGTMNACTQRKSFIPTVYKTM